MSHEPLLDSLKFAHRGERLMGKVAVASLLRLQDFLYDPSGELQYELKGRVGSDGRPAILCIIRGEVQLICQRCLDSIAFPIATQREFVLVSSESELPDLAEEADDVDVIVASATLDVLALVEDEVILGLPIAPRHEFDCGAPVEATESDPQTRSPFRALARIKRSTR